MKQGPTSLSPCFWHTHAAPLSPPPLFPSGNGFTCTKEGKKTPSFSPATDSQGTRGSPALVCRTAPGPHCAQHVCQPELWPDLVLPESCSPWVNECDPETWHHSSAWERRHISHLPETYGMVVHNWVSVHTKPRQEDPHEFPLSLGYIAGPCLKNNNKNAGHDHYPAPRASSVTSSL